MEDTIDRTRGLEDAVRGRLATHLHDGPIQRLTAVALTLDLFVMRLDGGDLAGAREYAEQARRDLATEMTSLRTLMTELRSPVLDEGSR
jgi:signal transduction histidine kinase